MNLQLNILRALVEVAGVKDIRSYLNCVHAYTENESVRYEATNGHIALKITVPNTKKMDLNVLIPTEVIKSIKDRSLFTLELDTSGPKHILHSTLFDRVDAKYPDLDPLFDAVVHEPSNEPATYNPMLLIKFQRAFNILSNRTATNPSEQAIPKIFQNGLEAAKVVARKIPDTMTATGLIMPLRN